MRDPKYWQAIKEQEEALQVPEVVEYIAYGSTEKESTPEEKRNITPQNLEPISQINQKIEEQVDTAALKKINDDFFDE